MTVEPSEICFLVCYDIGYADMAAITVNKNIKQYCLLHGYSLEEVLLKEKTLGRDFQWQKIKTAIEILKNKPYKWLFFMDVDCLIMHTPIKLETVIDDNFSFIVPEHKITAVDTPLTEFGEIKNIITSQFLVKNDEFGLKILEDIWSAREWPASIDINTHDYEGRQSRITIQKKEFKDKVKIVEEKTFNRFWIMNSPFMILRVPEVNDNVWEPGDFALHVTGYKKERRVELLSDLNFFSCGLLSNWQIVSGVIYFCPLISIENVTINIYDIHRKHLKSFELRNLSPKYTYSLDVKDINQNEIRIEAYDINQKQIALKLLDR